MRRLKNSNTERRWGWILGSLVLGAIPGGGQVPAEDGCMELAGEGELGTVVGRILQPG